MPKEWSGRQVYGVGELVALLAGELEAAFPDVWVEGEISGFRRAPSGHCYFSLKDSRAVLKAALFRSHAARMPFQPENGMAVLVRGKLSVFEASGDLQLYATVVEPAGLGALQMALEQAKRRLAAEGLTDPARRRPIPPFPRRVGVVTSLGGAALKDVLSVLRRRSAGFDLVVAPALVQGAGCPASVQSALDRLARVPGIDVVLLTRGGGSPEDLWGFNDEGLARRVAAHPVPVISAVGHEVDTVLTDLTADLRAATPSAAAELLTARVEEAKALAKASRRALERLALNRVGALRDRVSRGRPGRLRALYAGRLERMEEARDRLEERARKAQALRFEREARRLFLCRRALSADELRRWLGVLSERLVRGRRRMRSTASAALTFRRDRFSGLARLLDSLSPLRVLARGYSAAFDSGGRPVSDAAVLSPGDRLEVLFGRGAAACGVLMTRDGDPGELLGLGPRVDGPGLPAVESGPEEADRGREKEGRP
jgi:exodeoxyribonuclease VII large subunit